MTSIEKGKTDLTLLSRVNFPLYTIEMLTSRHIVVGGGGGSSKTGITNGFQILEIYHDGDNFVAKEIIRHDTGPTVVMNCAVKNDGKRIILVVGQESHSQMYFISTVIEKENEFHANKDKFDNSAPKIHKRKNVAYKYANDCGMKQSENFLHSNNKIITRQLLFEIKSSDSVQTDFTEQEPLQRVVRISPNGRLMATGGIDGHLRIWNFPTMTQLNEYAAHEKEIDDIDFSPDNKLIVSIGKDGKGIIWYIASDMQSLKLDWKHAKEIKYLFKRSRFGLIESQKEKFNLYTITNPLDKTGRAPSFLQQWNPESGNIINFAEINEPLAALAVRDDGRFIALGTMFSGSVSIYIAFSLQRVLHVSNAHTMFVTGLQFLPVANPDGPAISSFSETTLLSISVDNRICIHNIYHRHSIPAWLAIVLILGVLFLTFVICAYLEI